MCFSENVVKKLNVPTNRVVSVTLWDLPGHEDMDLRATYYKNVDAVVGKGTYEGSLVGAGICEVIGGGGNIGAPILWGPES